MRMFGFASLVIAIYSALFVTGLPIDVFLQERSPHPANADGASIHKFGPAIVNPPGSNHAQPGGVVTSPSVHGIPPGGNAASQNTGSANGGSVTNTGGTISNGSGSNVAGNGGTSSSGNAVGANGR